MKVKHKLIVIVAIALMGILTVGGIAAYNSTEDAKTAKEIETLRIPKIVEFSALDSAILGLIWNSYEILSKRDLPFEEQVSELRRVQQRANGTVKLAAELMQKAGGRPFNPEGKALWDRLVTAWGPWFEYDKIALVMTEKALQSPSQEAFNAVYDQIRQGNRTRRPYTLEIREVMEKLVQINNHQAEAALEESIASSEKALWKQIIAALIIMTILIAFAWSSILAIIRPLNRFRDMLGLVADQHDLTQRMNHKAKDEIGEMSVAFDHTLDALQAAFIDIRGQVENVTHAVEELTSTAQQVATSSQSQSSSSSAMAASVEEMAVSINTVSASATDAQSLAQEAGRISNEGVNIVEQTSSEMTVIAESVSGASRVIQTLGEASKEISNVVQVIREVADQTNLLALNAAIEAARAGEQGRGFAVVADEVRKLAERTAQSTGDISTMIGKIQTSAGEAVQEMGKVVEQVESGHSLAQEAGKRILAIQTEAGKVYDAMTEISNALKEQGEASNDIAKHVESIAQITDENNAAAEETASSAQRLDELAKNVQSTIGQFKV